MGSGFRLGAAGGGGVSGVTGESDRLQASAVVAGHSCLFLGESQQLLPDGLDQGGGGVGRGRCIQGGRGRQISHPRSVEVARGRRRLPDTTSGLCIFFRLRPGGEVVAMVVVPADASVLPRSRPDPRWVTINPAGQPHLCKMMELGACRSAHWSRSGGGGQLVSVEAPAGVQAVWLELLTLPRSFSWWQVAGAGALPWCQALDRRRGQARLSEPLGKTRKDTRVLRRT